ncbi:26S proteasome non-ATPase regulatory subunit 4-like protein [Drosera capensis]
MICIDNSEWMRNGDYSPNRFQAQADAVNLICGAKTQSNPENTVGVLTMAGKGVLVLITPTSYLGKILACVHGGLIGSEAPSEQETAAKDHFFLLEALEVVGRKLKKHSVALDIVNFGEDDDGKPEKLDALVALQITMIAAILSMCPLDQMRCRITPIFTGDGEGGSGFAASAAAAAAGGVTGFDFGVDP